MSGARPHGAVRAWRLFPIGFVACQPDALLHASRAATMLVAFPAGAIRGAQPDAVRLRIAQGALGLIDSTIAFPATETGLRIRFELKLDQDVDTVSVGVDLLENGIVLKSGVDTVTVESGAITTAVFDRGSLFAGSRSPFRCRRRAVSRGAAPRTAGD